MNPLMGILIGAILLALNALFVGSEFALISARRTQIEPRVEKGSWAAKVALSAMENVSQVMAAAQLGITLASLGLGSIAEPAIAHLVEPMFEAIGAPTNLVHPAAFVIAMSIVVFAHVVLGEMVPKNLALVEPERAALILGPFIVAIMVALKPFVVSLNAIANLMVRALRIEPKDEVASSFTHDEVAGFVDESRREGLLDDDEYGLVSGALDFYAGSVDQVLLPIDQLVTILPDATPIDVETACAVTGFSRFPVAGSDGLTGYLHIKDVLDRSAENDNRPIADKWVRPLATVAPGTALYDALRVMQARGSHMARVADASGRVLGVIMLEDVLEELVGEIRDSRSDNA